MAKIVQTAGRNALGEFAPEFAHYNDDVLFGENWNNQDIDVKTRSIITVVALMAQGITDSSLKFHLQNAKAHGVTQKEIAAIITHAAFYAGWPKGWAVFNLAKEVWEPGEGDLPYEDEAMRAHAKSMVFPIGQPNTAFAQYFIGNSYLGNRRSASQRPWPAAAYSGRWKSARAARKTAVQTAPASQSRPPERPAARSASRRAD